MATISQGSTFAYTASSDGAVLVVAVNGGNMASWSGALSGSIGPIPGRVTVGPLASGQTVTLSCDLGSATYEFGDTTPQGTGGNVALVVTPSQATALQAIGSGAGNAAVGGAFSLFGGLSNNAGAGYTFLSQHQSLAPYYGSRAIYVNYAAAQTITRGCSAASPTNLNNGNALTWTARTYDGGASSGSHGAGSGSASNIVPNIYVSDWLEVPYTARTDDPAKLPLILERTYYAAASNQRIVPANAATDMEAATGWQFGANIAAGDFVTSTGTGFTPTTSLSWFCPVGVEFSYGVPVYVVADVGDSLMRGQESSTVTNGWRSVSQRACLLKSSGIWQAATFAVTGQSHSASYLTGLEVVSKLRPRYLCFRAWSPNDGSPTQALIDAAWARTLALVEHCRRNRVTPVLCTTPPRNTLTVGEDALLKVQNARIKALAGWVLVSDEAAAVEDPADRSKLSAAANSGDGLHITTAGYNAMAVVRAAAMAY